MSCVARCVVADESVKYQTLPAVHLRHVTTPTSITTTVGHEVDVEGSHEAHLFIPILRVELSAFLTKYTT